MQNNTKDALLDLLKAVTVGACVLAITAVACMFTLVLWDQASHSAEPGVTLTRHQVVVDSTLPSCPSDDSGNNCSWNLNHDGNGEGSAYVIRHHRLTYVWSTDPRHGEWVWVPGWGRHILANHGQTLRLSCMWRTDGYSAIIRCANGNKMVVAW